MGTLRRRPRAKFGRLTEPRLAGALRPYLVTPIVADMSKTVRKNRRPAPVTHDAKLLIRVPGSLLAALDAAAFEHGRTRSGQARAVLCDWVEQRKLADLLALGCSVEQAISLHSGEK
jgi:hypothetical protein